MSAKIGRCIRTGETEKKSLYKLFAFTVTSHFIFGDRVYCKYHYLEGHEFDNSEMELLHFLKSFYNETWEWSAQYKVDEKYDENDDDDERDPGACKLRLYF